MGVAGSFAGVDDRVVVGVGRGGVWVAARVGASFVGVGVSVFYVSGHVRYAVGGAIAYGVDGPLGLGVARLLSSGVLVGAGYAGLADRVGAVVVWVVSARAV